MLKNNFYIWQVLRFIFFACIAYTVLIFCTIWHFASSVPSVPADCALIFGSAVHGDALPGPGIRRRVQAAVRLYNSNNVVQLFMAGGIGRAEQASEANVMRQYAIDLGVRSNTITTESTSTSTFENIRFSFQNRELQNCSHIVAVSDGYHLARIAFITTLMGLDNISLQPTNLSVYDKFFVYSALREVIALPYVFVHMTLVL